MLHMLQVRPKHFQPLPDGPKASMQHGCDMDPTHPPPIHRCSHFDTWTQKLTVDRPPRNTPCTAKQF